MNTEQLTTTERKIERFGQILGQMPGDELTVLALAEASFRRGLKLEALTAYQEVTKRKPVPEAHLAVAEIYSQQNMVNEAYSELSKLFEIDPENVEARLLAHTLEDLSPLPDEIQDILNVPTSDAAFEEADLRLRIQLTIHNRELQERTRNVTLEPGVVIHEYYVEEAKKKLMDIQEQLRQMVQLKAHNEELRNAPPPPRPEPVAPQAEEERVEAPVLSTSEESDVQASDEPVPVSTESPPDSSSNDVSSLLSQAVPDGLDVSETPSGEIPTQASELEEGPDASLTPVMEPAELQSSTMMPSENPVAPQPEIALQAPSHEPTSFEPPETYAEDAAQVAAEVAPPEIQLSQSQTAESADRVVEQIQAEPRFDEPTAGSEIDHSSEAPAEIMSDSESQPPAAAQLEQYDPPQQSDSLHGGLDFASSSDTEQQRDQPISTLEPEVMVDSRLESPIEPDFPDPGESNPDAGVSDPGASVLVSDGVGTTEGPDLSLQTSSETPEPSIEPATPHLPELSADVQQDQPEVVSEAFSTNFEIDSVVSPELPDPPSATSDQSQSIGVDEAEPTQGASSEDDASIAAQPVSVEPDSSAEPISVAPELPTDPVVPEPIGVSPDLPPDLEPVATAPEPDLPPHLEPTAGTPDLPPDLDPIVGAPEPDLPSDLDPIAVAPEPDVPNEPIAPLAVAPDSPAEPMAPPAPIAPIQVAPDLPSEPAPPIASEPVAIEPPVIDDIAPEVAPPEVVPAPAASVVNAAERQAYYESKAEELGKLTAALARTRGVTSIFLVARDGSTIDSVVKDDVTEERVGELVKESFEFLLAYAKSPSYWVLECTGGIFVMQTLDAHHVLIAIGQAGANFGALRYTMDKTKAKFGSILDNVPL